MKSFTKELILLIPAVLLGSFVLKSIFLAELPPSKVVSNFIEAEQIELDLNSSVKEKIFKIHLV